MDTIKVLKKSIRDYKLPSILTPIFIIGEVVLETLIPTMEPIIKYGLILLAMALASLVCGFIAGKFAATASCGYARNLRHDMYYKIQDFSFAEIDRFSTSSLVTRLTTDVTNVQNAYQMIIRIAIRTPLMLIFAFVFSFRINWRIALVFLAAMPVLMLALALMMKFVMPFFRKIFRKYDDMNESVQENVQAIRVVKSFATEDLETKRFEKDNEDFVKIKRQSYMNMGGFFSSITLFSSIVYILTAVTGAAFIQKGHINTADLITYLLFVNTLLGTVDILVQFTEQYQQGIAGFQRYCNLMDTPEDISDKPDAIDIESFDGEIEFSDVSFRYNDGADVLNHLSVTVEKGESVAIVGPSGGGKTTMVSLIPRFYDVNSGAVRIDGKDVRDVTLRSLRKCIGIVQQDVYLFNGTVAENIAYGNPSATREDVVKAATAAGVNEFVDKMSDGYDTVVGERGVKLSGGQKQRISIARLFLKNPPILILDEATSALDNESERMVQKSLDKLAEGRTTLTIAHRLTTIKNAERILVLTENGIAEDGNHKELMERGGIYANLYRTYEN